MKYSQMSFNFCPLPKINFTTKNDFVQKWVSTIICKTIKRKQNSSIFSIEKYWFYKVLKIFTIKYQKKDKQSKFLTLTVIVFNLKKYMWNVTIGKFS